MKKLIKLTIILLLFPLLVFAEVDKDTQTTAWELESTSNAASLCSAEESKNTANLSSATSGYYLYCIKISCSSSKVTHDADNPLTGKLTCANGNTNPYIIVSSSGAQDDELKVGATCSSTGTFAYATEKMWYNCAKVNDGTEEGGTFISDNTPTPTSTTTTNTNQTPASPSENNTNTNSNGNTNNNVTSSPATGVEDYILGLTIAAIVLISFLYFVNKKNVFKRI